MRCEAHRRPMEATNKSLFAMVLGRGASLVMRLWGCVFVLG